MTIGIGFQSQDGVVLCADRQMTVQGNFKYPERKIKAHFDGFSSFIFTYAGFPEPAEAMFDKLGDNLEEQYKKARGRSPIDKTKAAVQKIFDDKRAKGLYVLLGVSIGNLGQPFLL